MNHQDILNLPSMPMVANLVAYEFIKMPDFSGSAYRESGIAIT